MFSGQGLSLEAYCAAKAERRASSNTATGATSVAAAAAAASTAAAAATGRASSASSQLITIMASIPPKCPVLPDSRALTAAFVVMDEDRFSLMFAENVQVLCASGSDCKVHPGAGPVDSSIHWCKNFAQKFYSCITCSGVQFADWISGVLLQGGCSHSLDSQEKFDCNKDDYSSSLLELCSYYQKSIALSINVGHSCGEVVVTVTVVPGASYCCC